MTDRRATIDVEDRQIVVGRGAAARRVEWAELAEATLARVPSLADEIGLGLVLDGRRLWLRETQPGFWALFDALGLARALPPDWYPRAESGERFDVDARG